ncbi:hypothetical protein ABTX62_16365 [Streptomyces sp. NPDC096046]
MGRVFTGRVVARTREEAAIDDTGSAYRKGGHRFVLDPDDEPTHGFLP